MHVLFSTVDPKFLQGDEVLKDAEGNAYNYVLGASPFCESEFIIKDSAKRFVPFQYKDLDVLIEALENFRVNLLDGFFTEPDSVAVIS